MANALTNPLISPFGSLFGKQKDPFQSTLDPAQKGVEGQLGSAFNNINPNSFMYNGQLNAPITQGEQDVVGNNARMNAIAGNTFGQLGSYDPAQIEANFNSQIAHPTIQNFLQDEAPALREQLNGFSSEQGNVLNRGFQTLNNNLLQQRMNYQNQAQQNALGALAGANTYNQGAAQIQSIPRAIQQSGLDRAYNNFTQGNAAYQQSLNQMLNFLGIQTQAYIRPTDPLQQIIGAAGAGANIAGAMSGNPASGASLASSASGAGSGSSTNYGLNTSPYAPNNDPYGLLSLQGR